MKFFPRSRIAKIVVATLVLLFAAGAAGVVLYWRSPDVRKQRYLASGKEFMAQQKYAQAQIQFMNAARLDPKWAEAQYQLAAASIQAGDLVVAYKALEAAVAADPGHVEARLRMAEMLLAAKKYRTAGAEARKALELRPGQSQAEAIVALAHAGLGDTETAERELEGIVSRDPAMASAVANLAALKMQKEDRAAAEQVLRQAADRAPSVASFTMLGNALLDAGKADEAEKWYRAAKQREPANVQPAYALLRLLLRQNRIVEAESLAREISEGHQESPRERSVAARLKLARGEVDQGLAELEQVVKRYPDDGFNHALLAAALLRAGRPDAAAGQAELALRQNAADADALFVRGIVSIVRNKPQEALKDLYKVLTRWPGFSEGHYYMGLAHLQLSQRGFAVLAFRRAVKYRPANLTARLALAGTQLQARDETGAMETLNAAPPPQDRDPEIRLARATALRQKGDREAAEKELHQLAQDSPGFAPAQTSLGVLLLQQADLGGAQAAFRAALATGVEDGQAADGLASTYLRQNQAAAGEQEFKRIVMERPRFRAAVAALARIQQAQGRTADGEQQVDAYLRLVPGDAAMIVLRADLARSRGDFAAAERLLREVARNDPKHVEAAVKLGMVFEAQNRRQDAVRQYRQALALRSDQPTAANNLAWLLCEGGGDLNEAANLAQAAKRAEPENAAFIDTLGWAFFKKGDYESAVKELKDAASRDSANPAIQYHLGMAYLKNKNPSLALQSLRAAVAAGQDFPGASEARDTLKALQGAHSP